MSYLGLGQTQTRTPERLLELCRQDQAAGRLDSLWCQEYTRRMGVIPAPPPDESPAALATLRAERERQAAAEREAIARRLEAAGISPTVAQAVRTQQELVYARTKPEGEAIARLEAELRLAELERQERELARQRVARAQAALRAPQGAPQPIPPPVVIPPGIARSRIPRVEGWGALGIVMGVVLGGGILYMIARR